MKRAVIMRNIKIQKEDNELFIALNDYLQILKEEIESVIVDKPYRVRVIVAILRLLICDRSNRGGLLTHLVDKYGFMARSLQTAKTILYRNTRTK